MAPSEMNLEDIAVIYGGRQVVVHLPIHEIPDPAPPLFRRTPEDPSWEMFWEELAERHRLPGEVAVSVDIQLRHRQAQITYITEQAIERYTNDLVSERKRPMFVQVGIWFGMICAAIAIIGLAYMGALTLKGFFDRFKGS